MTILLSTLSKEFACVNRGAISVETIFSTLSDNMVIEIS